MDPDWLVFDPHPSKPTFSLPPGSVDAHCHVFGPGDQFPYAPERKYTPCDAGKDELFALRDHLGFERNVVVQATCHGADNARDGRRAARRRGSRQGRRHGPTATSATPSCPSCTPRACAAVRFNYVRRLVDPEPDEYYHRIVERIAPLGWHVVLYFEAADLAERWNFFTSLETTVVVDHMGRPDVTKSVDGPQFAIFLRLMEEHENFWCKVTCPERLSVSGPPDYDDVVPVRAQGRRVASPTGCCGAPTGLTPI